MKEGFLYEIINKFNNKKYVGVTSMKLSSRWSVHLYRLRKGIANSKIQGDFLKYGEDAFLIKKIKSGNIKDLYLEEEKLTKNKEYEYNIIIGGNSPESKKEMYECYVEKLNNDKEFKAKCFKKISDSLKGKKHSEKTKLKISKTKIGKKMPDGFAEKRAIQYKGENNPNAVYFLNLNTGIYYSSYDIAKHFSLNIGTIRRKIRESNFLLKDFIRC